jgi:hypothetical protein
VNRDWTTSFLRIPHPLGDLYSHNDGLDKTEPGTGLGALGFGFLGICRW